MSYDTDLLQRLARASRTFATPKPWIAGATRQRFCAHAPSPVLLCPGCVAVIQHARIQPRK